MNGKASKMHGIRWAVYVAIQVLTLLVFSLVEHKSVWIEIIVVLICIALLTALFIRRDYYRYEASYIYFIILVLVTSCAPFLLIMRDLSSVVNIVCVVINCLSSQWILRSSIFHAKRFYSEPMTEQCGNGEDLIPCLSIALGAFYCFSNTFLCSAAVDTFEKGTAFYVLVVAILVCDVPLLLSVLFRWKTKFECNGIKTAFHPSDDGTPVFRYDDGINCSYYIKFYYSRYDGMGDMFSTTGVNGIAQDIMAKVESLAKYNAMYQGFTSFFPYAVIMSNISYIENYDVREFLEALKMIGCERHYIAVHRKFNVNCKYVDWEHIEYKKDIEFDFFRKLILHCKALDKFDFTEALDILAVQAESKDCSCSEKEYIDKVVNGIKDYMISENITVYTINNRKEHL